MQWKMSIPNWQRQLWGKMHWIRKELMKFWFVQMVQITKAVSEPMLHLVFPWRWQGRRRWRSAFRFTSILEAAMHADFQSPWWIFWMGEGMQIIQWIFRSLWSCRWVHRIFVREYGCAWKFISSFGFSWKNEIFLLQSEMKVVLHRIWRMHMPYWSLWQRQYRKPDTNREKKWRLRLMQQQANCMMRKKAVIISQGKADRKVKKFSVIQKRW